MIDPDDNDTTATGYSRSISSNSVEAFIQLNFFQVDLRSLWRTETKTKMIE